MIGSERIIYLHLNFVLVNKQVNKKHERIGQI